MNLAIAVTLLVTLSAVPIPPEFSSRSPHARGPVWIQSSEFVGADGKLVSTRLAPADAITLNYYLTRNPRTAPVKHPQWCDVALGARIDDTPALPVRSMSAVKARAERGRVVIGTITATAVGLYAGSPFTVLQVTPGDESERLYLLYPRGVLEVEGKRICTDDARYTAEPRVNDKILAVLDEAVDDGDQLYRLQPELLFFEKNGDAIVSGHLRQAAGATPFRFDKLARELQPATRNPAPEH